MNTKAFWGTLDSQRYSEKTQNSEDT